MWLNDLNLNAKLSSNFKYSSLHNVRKLFMIPEKERKRLNEKNEEKKGKKEKYDIFIYFFQDSKRILLKGKLSNLNFSPGQYNSHLNRKKYFFFQDNYGLIGSFKTSMATSISSEAV